MPVDESLGLVDDYLTRPAAQLGLLMMGHCTAREAAAFFAKIGGMTPSVSTLQRLTRTMHERWETLGPETLDSIRDAERVPHEAVSASVSLDGVMVPLRAGEDGRAEASWREAACGTVSFHDARGERLKTLYLGRMPESGKVTLKAQLASEVAHIRQLRPDVRIVAIADAAAIGSGVVEAANKTLVTQRMKRSGMRWRIASGQGCADLPRPDQIRSLRPGMEGHHRRNRHTGQRQHQSLCRHRQRCLNSMNEALLSMPYETRTRPRGAGARLHSQGGVRHSDDAGADRAS